MSFDDMLNTGSAAPGLSFGQDVRDAEKWLPNPDGSLKWRGGTLINEPRKTQLTKFEGKGKKGAPLFWPNSTDPKEQIGFPLQTPERDGGPLDDGRRTLYAKIQGDFPGDMLTEIRRELQKAGGGMTLGCQIYVALVELKPTDGQPQRLYKAHYIPAPSQGDQLVAETGPQHAAGAPSQPPAQQQPQYQQAPPMAAPPAQQPVYAGLPNGQQAPPQYAPPAQQQPQYQQVPAQQPPAAPAQTERPPWEQ